MENSKNIIINEDPIISCPSTPLNFGVYSQKIIKSPKNLFMSFTPLSTNKEITYTNTIMYPVITTEATIDTEKNYSNIENEKLKLSLKKDSTGFKTESSKDEKINISYEKQISNILIINNETNKKDEDIDESESNKGNKDSLETNPFYLGGKSSYNLNEILKNNNINNDTEIEKEKVKKMLDKNKKVAINEKNANKENSYFKTSKNIKNKVNKEIFRNQLKRKTQRMKTLNFNKQKKANNSEQNTPKRNLKKSIARHKTCFGSENKINLNYNYKDKKKNFEFDTNIKKMKHNILRTRTKVREKTVMNTSPMFKIKEHNIKLYKLNLFNQNNNSAKGKQNIDIIAEKEEIEKKMKAKKKKLTYIGVSENKLNTKLIMDYLKNKKEENGLNKKKEDKQIQLNNSIQKDSKKDIRNRKRTLSQSLHNKFHRLKTFTGEIAFNDKNKVQTTYKKRASESRKNLDFDFALKNKKNLANTQFNLFSPEKFTNTTFSDSDYCEYTLDCMDLILNKNKSERQIKNKVNFNFPKIPKNKPRKKIALFDLDETLVHCTGDINLKKEKYQHKIDIILPGTKEVSVGINIRPLWKKTLNLIKKYYNIVVFTASHQAYADAVLDFMDPNKKYFKYRLYRNNCSLVNVDGAQFYVKDLDIFNEAYDLKDIVIVDNSVLSFIYHLENGIPIVPYYSEDKDGSLYIVGLYLMHIYKEDDLREANKKYINLDSFLNEAKNRNDENSTINEESISIENNNINSNTNVREISIKNNNTTPIKLDLNTDNNTNTNNIKEKDSSEKISQNYSSGRRDSNRLSIKNEATTPQKNLIKKSKLMEMYYSLNDKSENTKNIFSVENKNNRNFSTDDEKEIKEIKEIEQNKDISAFYFKNRRLTGDAKSENRNKNRNSQHSCKTCAKQLDLKLMKSKFFNNFSSEESI